MFLVYCIGNASDWTWKETRRGGLHFILCVAVGIEDPVEHCLEMHHFCWDCTHILCTLKPSFIILMLYPKCEQGKWSQNNAFSTHIYCPIIWTVYEAQVPEDGSNKLLWNVSSEGDVNVVFGMWLCSVVDEFCHWSKCQYRTTQPGT